MAVKTKRTYNLSQTTIHRVRDLAGRSGLAATQDGVVELAVERFYLDVVAEEEAAAWAAAREDPDFQAEIKAISGEDDDAEDWPT